MPNGGLSNRLQSIISTIVLCEERDIIPDFLWAMRPEVGNGKFEDYFTSNRRFISVEKDNADWILKEHGRTAECPKVPDRRVVEYWGFAHLEYENPDVEGYQRLLKGIDCDFIKPQPEIEAIVDDYCSANNIFNTVGIHVRDYEHDLNYSGNRDWK